MNGTFGLHYLRNNRAQENAFALTSPLLELNQVNASTVLLSINVSVQCSIMFFDEFDELYCIYCDLPYCDTHTHTNTCLHIETIAHNIVVDLRVSGFQGFKVFFLFLMMCLLSIQADITLSLSLSVSLLLSVPFCWWSLSLLFDQAQSITKVTESISIN